MIIFYLFSLINLINKDLDIITIIKNFFKNTIFLIIFISLISYINSNKITKVITTDCYDSNYVADNFNITTDKLSIYNSLIYNLIEEKINYNNINKLIYCKLKNINVKANYLNIKWKIDTKIKSKIEEIWNKIKSNEIKKIVWEKLILSEIYNNWNWITNNNISIWNNKWFILFQNNNYKIISFNQNSLIEANKIAIIDYNNLNDFITLVLYNNDTKTMKVFIINSPLNQENILKITWINKESKSYWLLQKYILLPLKNITPFLENISFIYNWIYKININWQKFYTMAELYKIIYNYDENNWDNNKNDVIWANIAFNNWKMYDWENKKLYDINLTSNSYYYKLNQTSNISPYNSFIIVSGFFYLIFYILTFLSIIALLFVYLIIIK